MIKKVYNTLIQILPFKLSILKIIAGLPVNIKSHYLFRIASNISQYCDPKSEVTSNLGINNQLKVKVKITDTVQAFGNPVLYTPEYSTLELCSKLLKHTDAFLDIGAHIGYFCYYLENQNSKRIPLHFFEPDPDLFKNIKSNVNANGLTNINGSDMAFSDKIGELTFFKNLNDTYSGSIKNTFQNKHTLQEIKVKTTTFDDYVEHLPYNNYLLKVDVESAEFEFMKGAEKQVDKIQYLVIELLQDSIENNYPELMIKEYKFNAFYINNFDLIHSKDGEFDYQNPFYNWLFTKDSIEELELKLKKSQFKIKR